MIANASSVPVDGHPEFDSIPKHFPGYDAPSIQGIIAPGKTPKEIVAKLEADFRDVILKGAAGPKLKDFGMVPVASTAAEYNATISREIKKWTETAKKANISLD